MIEFRLWVDPFRNRRTQNNEFTPTGQSGGSCFTWLSWITSHHSIASIWALFRRPQTNTRRATCQPKIYNDFLFGTWLILNSTPSQHLSWSPVTVQTFRANVTSLVRVFALFRDLLRSADSYPIANDSPVRMHSNLGVDPEPASRQCLDSFVNE